MRRWLLGLSREDRRKIGIDIATVEYGWPIGMPTCKSLGGGLWEVRTRLDRTRQARILFCVAEGEIVLLHGFMKTASRTPMADLSLSRARQREVER